MCSGRILVPHPPTVLAVKPATLLDRLPKVEDFSYRLRGPQVTSRVGRWLGVAFAVAFLTGVWSHLQQDTPGWLSVPTRPVRLYQVTQGLHIIAGTVAVPLLLVKLWSVFPRFFQRPPRPGRALLVHLLERLSIGVLMAAAIFQLVTGLANSSQWYPWSFSFRSTHYAVAWVAITALIVHVAVKLPVIRAALGVPVEAAVPPDGVEEPREHEGETRSGGLTRRGLLRTTWVAAGLAALATAGASVPVLRNVSLFAVRSGEGPQGLPVNRSADAAGVVGIADDPDWRLEVTYQGESRTYDRDELMAMPQSTHVLPITCVEGWSATATWTGVRMADLVTAMGAPAASDVLVTSMQRFGAFGVSLLPEDHTADPLTLLALQVNGMTLNLDHGYPCRIIAPNRPGVWQTKWVQRLEIEA